VLLRGLWPWRELRNWAEVEEARRLGELERAEDLALSGSELAALGDRAFGGGEGGLSVPRMPVGSENSAGLVTRRDTR
jgi:hypothetical protein